MNAPQFVPQSLDNIKLAIDKIYSDGDDLFITLTMNSKTGNLKIISNLSDQQFKIRLFNHIKRFLNDN